MRTRGHSPVAPLGCLPTKPGRLPGCVSFTPEPWEKAAPGGERRRQSARETVAGLRILLVDDRANQAPCQTRQLYSGTVHDTVVCGGAMSRNPFDKQTGQRRWGAHVLLVLHDVDRAIELVQVLEGKGYRASWVQTVEEAIAVTRHVLPDLIAIGRKWPVRPGTADIPTVRLPDNEDSPVARPFDDFLRRVECACPGRQVVAS